MKKFLPKRTLFLDLVLIPLSLWIRSTSMKPKKPDLVPRFSDFPVYFDAAEFRVSSVETKHGLEVPVSVNQDEKELLLTRNWENLYLWYETEFPKELEVQGMRKARK